MCDEWLLQVKRSRLCWLTSSDTQLASDQARAPDLWSRADMLPLTYVSGERQAQGLRG